MCAISYSTSVTKGFLTIYHKLDLMYVKFIHEYTARKCIDEDEFYKACKDLATLKKAYEQVGIISINGEEGDEGNKY